MIIHLPTGKTFITQKDAKLYFGNHYYRRLVKKGDIYFTNYNSKVANDQVHQNNWKYGWQVKAERSIPILLSGSESQFKDIRIQHKTDNIS